MAVLDDRESEHYFGAPLPRRRIQPVWVRIVNRSTQPYRLRLAGIDPNYYPALEAAYVNHYGIGKRLIAFGPLAWFFVCFGPKPGRRLAARDAREDQNERLHLLRLWMTPDPAATSGKCVTLQTWNLTTHQDRPEHR